MKQRAIDCGILPTTKSLFAEMLCLKRFIAEREIRLDPVNKKFEVESFQKIQDVSVRGDSESIEVVGDVGHISEAETQSDQICPKRVHRSTAWLQDYETSYVGIPKDQITGWMQNPKGVFFLTMQMKQRAIDCGILPTTKSLFAEMLC